MIPVKILDSQVLENNETIQYTRLRNGYYWIITRVEPIWYQFVSGPLGSQTGLQFTSVSSYIPPQSGVFVKVENDRPFLASRGASSSFHITEVEPRPIEVFINKFFDAVTRTVQKVTNVVP
jgi:hypothetical protein